VYIVVTAFTADEFMTNTIWEGNCRTEGEEWIDTALQRALDWLASRYR